MLHFLVSAAIAIGLFEYALSLVRRYGGWRSRRWAEGRIRKLYPAPAPRNHDRLRVLGSAAALIVGAALIIGHVQHRRELPPIDPAQPWLADRRVPDSDLPNIVWDPLPAGMCSPADKPEKVVPCASLFPPTTR